jgi:hypothetical protein
MRSLTSIFVALIFVMATATTSQAQLNEASESKNAITIERMIYHVLVDGPKDFEEYGWTVTFSETNSSTATDDVRWIEYLVTAKKQGIPTNTCVVREVWGIHKSDRSLEHAISVKVWPRAEE